MKCTYSSFSWSAMPQSLTLSFLSILITHILTPKLTPTQAPTAPFLKTLLTEPSQTKGLWSINTPKPQPIQQALLPLPAVAEKKQCPRIPLPLQLPLMVAAHITHIYRTGWGWVGRELATYLAHCIKP